MTTIILIIVSMPILFIGSMIFRACRRIYKEDSIAKYVRDNINEAMGKENEKMFVDSLPKFVNPKKEINKYSGNDAGYYRKVGK
jgi:hypothetical protein